ncbi:MAG TPA: hypothetical protein VM052_04470 [Candidatus Limnocylindrales bacterium]|nr:hypothetical protein [Candidatus Limnocylindrales bacterium]
MAIRRRMLALLERVAPGRLGAVRRASWDRRMFLYVTPGEVLVERALAGFPEDVRELGRACRIIRTNARSGGGFYPDRNEVELAAGVETYEGLGQVELSACHELFHFICWNDPRYRYDEDQNFPYMRRAVFDSRTILDRYPRYREWVTGSFLRQGGHANPVEYFADIPTNFRRTQELPPPIRTHFAPLIDGTPMPYDMSRKPDWPIDPATLELDVFQRWLAGTD